MFRKLAVICMALVLTLGLLAMPALAATDEEIEESVEAGVAWLVDQQDPESGCWDNWLGARVASTGFAVVKLSDYARERGLDPLDPEYQYSDNIAAGLECIFSMADDDGCGLHFEWYETYETGIAMMAIASIGDLEQVVNVSGSVVDGWTYGAVLEANVSYFANSQTDSGGWSYACGEEDADNSNTGYAVLGLRYAEAAGIDIPASIKLGLQAWVAAVQDTVNGDTNDGGSWYRIGWSWVNLLKTGNLLFEMEFVGDTVDTPRVQDAIDYIERHWDDANWDPGWKGPGWGGEEWPEMQTAYCLMKGLEAFNIQELVVAGETIDWFDEMSTAIVEAQNDDGSWSDTYWGGPMLSTEWALLTLERVVPPLEVEVDIKPGSYPNSINLKSKGVIPVAILTTSTEAGDSVDFDATAVDPDTVVFAGAMPVHWAIEDVDHDGDMDMILHFRTQETAIECSDSEARLDGLTYDGKQFYGVDSVRPICKGK